MKKRKTNIMKEVIIVMLLLILIMLILAVALYDFVPSNINIADAIEYSSDSKTTSIKQEIAYTNGGDTDIDETSQTEEELVTYLMSYSINSSDLTVYGQKNLYNSGNSNPFDYATEETGEQSTDGTSTDGTSTDVTNNSVEQQNSTSTTSTTQSSSSTSTTGTFFESSTSK